ncbi:hypothetical protein ABZ917_36440 [Nonomuraea wenchangensis]
MIRRNVIDFERKPSHIEAHLTVASIALMTTDQEEAAGMDPRASVCSAVRLKRAAGSGSRRLVVLLESNALWHGQPRHEPG